ncbi:MAG: hypothetical protein HY897_06580 [Deltaproteobacteria bacterium]|nr:hypothetical protein [Deltaproteobacteria bacterium]
MKPLSSQESQALELWKAAEADFQNEMRHKAFITYCAQTGILPFAAARYTEWEKTHPRNPVVARCREMLVAQAVASMGAPAPPGGLVGFVHRYKAAIIVVSVIVTLALAFLVLQKLQVLKTLVDSIR